MHIKVLGPGCAKCEEARQLAEKVVRENNVQATVEKVSDLKVIMALGVLSTPAIIVDDVVKCTGRVPSTAELLGWLTSSASGSCTGQEGGSCCCSCGGKC